MFIVRLRGDVSPRLPLAEVIGDEGGWAVCCWATNCRAAAAAIAAGGKGRPGRPGKPVGGKADKKSLGARGVGIPENPVGFEIGGLTGA